MSQPFDDNFFEFVKQNEDHNRSIFCLVLPSTTEEVKEPFFFGDIKKCLPSLSSIITGYWTGMAPPMRHILHPPGGFR